MATPAIHVVPRGNRRWAVEREGATRPASMHPTQAEATKAGRALAKRDHSEFVVHRKDGQIRARDSYGNDPYPPRG